MCYDHAIKVIWKKLFCFNSGSYDISCLIAFELKNYLNTHLWFSFLFSINSQRTEFGTGRGYGLVLAWSPYGVKNFFLSFMTRIS